MHKTKTIIWDWNGTLLNDLELCISSINTLLEKRKLPVLDKYQYREVFSFPVKDYYEAIGFDFTKEDFSIPAHEFIDLYDSHVEECPLHENVVEVLKFYKNKGFRQFVLSAMHENMLVKTLKHNNIFHYFESVAGLNNHYAVSKIERGLQLISQFKIDKKSTLMIGDTIHDYEVARELGIKCILVADGHQSADRLKTTGVKVVDGINQLIEGGVVQLLNNSNITATE